MESEELKILIVDDEPDILEFLSFALEREGYQVYTAIDGREGLEMSLRHMPDLMILDIMMPEMSGIELCQELRKRPEFDDSLIAFLTAKSGEIAELEAFESGGDDYISKPIKPKVFVSRVKALLRRLPKSINKSSNLLIFGELSIDLEKFELYIGEQFIPLARKEFELIKLLTSKPGKVFSRPEILNKVWGSDVIVIDRTVDVHIRKIRSKIGDQYIKTLKGVGYKFNF